MSDSYIDSYLPADNQRIGDIPLEDDLGAIEERARERDEKVRLMAQAKKKGKGSIPFQILETKHGLDGDHHPSDWGMEQEKPE